MPGRSVAQAGSSPFGPHPRRSGKAPWASHPGCRARRWRASPDAGTILAQECPGRVPVPPGPGERNRHPGWRASRWGRRGSAPSRKESWWVHRTCGSGQVSPRPAASSRPSTPWHRPPGQVCDLGRCVLREGFAARTGCGESARTCGPGRHRSLTPRLIDTKEAPDHICHLTRHKPALNLGCLGSPGSTGRAAAEPRILQA